MAVSVRQSSDVQRRLLWVALIFVVGYVALVARLFSLQVVDGLRLRAKAIDGRSRPRHVDVTRGAILDRNGKPLALSVSYGTLVCDPTKVCRPDDAARLLAEALHTDVSAVRSRLVPCRRPAPVSPEHPDGFADSRREVILDDLGAEQASQLRGLIARTRPKTLLQGIYVEDRVVRRAEGGPDFAQLVGLIHEGKDGMPEGISGVEKGMNALLAGSPGQYEAEFDRRGRVIPNTQRKWRESRPGVDVRLTVDAAIQHMAESALRDVAEKHHPVGATLIVVDPRTGDLLASASYPTFDPDNRSATSLTLESQKDRAFTRYEPGSTMKSLTIARALDDGTILRSDTLYCSGRLTIGNRTLSCAAHGDTTLNAHGPETPMDILVHSCNVCTAQIGMKLGIERMEACLRAFGLLQPVGLGLPSDTRGYFSMGRAAFERGMGKVARAAFGQSVVVTPMGMAYAYAALANGGVPMKPRLVMAQEDGDGRVIRRFDPQPRPRVVRPETARFIVAALEQAVLRGTGKAAAVPGYSVAGKTGTAQKVLEGRGGYAPGKYVASFIGMIPARSPRAVIAVVIDEPQEGHLGGVVAAPVFREVAQQLMWYLKVQPDKPETLDPRLASARTAAAAAARAR